MNVTEPPVTSRWPSSEPYDPSAAPATQGVTTHGLAVAPPGHEWPSVSDYDILSLLGCGGMGVVYKAWHRELHRTVALKTLRGAAAADPEYRVRFQAEAEAVARLQHPNIIQVFEIGSLDPRPGEYRSCPFIAFEFVDGGNLDQFTETPQPPLRAARMVEKLARAAHAAHLLGVVHRDLKPANVLLTPDGEPKVADFGVAKQLGTDSASRYETMAGVAVGTPEYMAPEQVSGEAPTPAIDTYALGVILYELLTARLPFHGPSPAATMDLIRTQEPVSPRRLQPGLPRDLETICLKCLAKAPGRRYETAGALADDLAAWADGRPITARPLGPVGRAARWAWRNPTVAALSAAVAVVGVVGVAGVVAKWQEARAHAAAPEAEATEARDHAAAERWGRYRAEVVAATAAIRLYDPVAARRALAAAPPVHRDWEWRYAARQLDAASRAMVAGDGVTPLRAYATTGGGHAAYLYADVVHVLDVATGRSAGAVNGKDIHTRCRLDPRGEVLAVAERAEKQYAVTLVDVATGRERAVLRGHATGVCNITFSEDRKFVVTGSLDGEFRVWDAATGAAKLVLSGHTGRAGEPSFAGNRLATAGKQDGTIRVWDTDTGRLLRVLAHPGADVAAVRFSPGGELLAACELHPMNPVRLWDVRTGKLVADLIGHKNIVTSYSFNPDGTRIVTTSDDQTARLWDGATGKLVAELRGHTGQVKSAAFSPDGTRLVTSSQDHTLRLWDGRTGAFLAVLYGHTSGVCWCEYAPDGATVVSVGRDATARVWDVAAVERGGTLRGHEGYVYSVSAHPDGRHAASAAWDGTVRVWDIAAGREVFAVRHEGQPAVSVAYNRDGKYLASLGRDHAVRLWDAAAGAAVCHWPVPTHAWFDSRLAFAPDQDLLAVAAGDGTVRLFDARTRTEAGILTGHDGPVRDVAFSPDGRWLATGGGQDDRTIRVWDVARRESVAVLSWHKGHVYSLAFHPAGGLLASGSTDGTIRLWHTTNWDVAGVLEPNSGVYGLAFSPGGGTRLVAGCEDNTIRFWDVAARAEVGGLTGHTDYVHSVTFTPDGSRLLSASGDYTVRVWEAAPLPAGGR